MGFRGQEFAFASPAAAVAELIARLRPCGLAHPPEIVPLESARGRILAEPIACDRDSPAFNHSAMDGYAVRVEDLAGAIGGTGIGDRPTLAVVAEVRIGNSPPDLPVGSAVAIRIVTGAAIPSGANAVVRREDVTEHADGRQVTAISIAPDIVVKIEKGSNIRERAQNARAGDTLMESGTLLSAAALGSLAAVGCVKPRVHRRVRVAIITTGDELVPPDETPATFQIRDSNAPAIAAVLGAQAWIELVSPGAEMFVRVRDDQNTLDGAVREAIAHANAIVIIGGASMGHRDSMRAAVERSGADVIFHGLPVRPGKPMLGAVLKFESRPPVPMFGLPGNPVSAMVTCVRFVLPILAAIAGARAGAPPASCIARLVPLINDDGKTLDVWWHRLVRINSAGQAELIEGRGSGDIVAGGRSDGFVELPPARPAIGLSPPQSSVALVPFYPWPL